MEKKVVKIDPIGFFPVDPNSPEEMNEQYPYMNCLFVEPVIKSCPDTRGLYVVGFADHMDENPQNPVFYAGTLARHVLPDCDWRDIDHIHMACFVDDGVPEPEGAVEYFYKGKTLHYRDESGDWHDKKVDVSMIYIDRYMTPSEETDPGLSEFIQKMNEGVEKIEQDHSDEYWDERNRDYEQKKLDFWKRVWHL